MSKIFPLGPIFRHFPFFIIRLQKKKLKKFIVFLELIDTMKSWLALFVMMKGRVVIAVMIPFILIS